MGCGYRAVAEGDVEYSLTDFAQIIARRIITCSAVKVTVSHSSGGGVPIVNGARAGERKLESAKQIPASTLTKGAETIRASETRSYISGSVQNGASTDWPLPTFPLLRARWPVDAAGL